jgi:hypothetical protein
MTPHSRFTSILTAVALAATVALAAQGRTEETKDKGTSVSGAAKAASTTTKGAKATAGGAKKLGLGIKDAVTPDKNSEKKK